MNTKTIAENRVVRHEYFIIESYEAGIELFGTEVKSIRNGGVNLKDSWISIENGEAFIRNMPSASRITVSMLRNLFIVTFLFQFPIRLKSEEEPGIINQIYQIVGYKRQQKRPGFLTYCNAINQHHNHGDQHSHHTHQQINLQHSSWHPVTAAFGHINHEYSENKEEKRNQRITAEIVMRIYRKIRPTAYNSYQYRQERCMQ